MYKVRKLIGFAKGFIYFSDSVDSILRSEGSPGSLLPLSHGLCRALRYRRTDMGLPSRKLEFVLNLNHKQCDTVITKTAPRPAAIFPLSPLTDYRLIKPSK